MWGDPKVARQEGDSRIQSIQGPRLFFIASIMKRLNTALPRSRGLGWLRVRLASFFFQSDVVVLVRGVRGSAGRSSARLCARAWIWIDKVIQEILYEIQPLCPM